MHADISKKCILIIRLLDILKKQEHLKKKNMKCMGFKSKQNLFLINNYLFFPNLYNSLKKKPTFFGLNKFFCHTGYEDKMTYAKQSLFPIISFSPCFFVYF